MPVTSANACAKIILLGEHAVVYGEPALAIPFSGLRVRCVIEPWIKGPPGTLQITAPELNLDQSLQDLPEDNFIRQAIYLVLGELGVPAYPPAKWQFIPNPNLCRFGRKCRPLLWQPLRALSSFLGHPLLNEKLNQLAFQTEKLIHGNPSGIDNTVIVYEQPLLFRKAQPIEFIQPGSEMHFLIADSGIKKATAETVAYLAQQREHDPERVDAAIHKIGKIVLEGKRAFETGDMTSLGAAMNNNQALLADLNLSCPELDSLITAALQAGALGAKLTGGGKGGNMLALVTPDTQEAVRIALQTTGAVAVHQTSLKRRVSHG